MTISVLIPANNEADHIGVCLAAVFASQFEEMTLREVVVIANGCSDATVEITSDLRDAAELSGWNLVVLDLLSGGKMAALNAGDEAAQYDTRIYLDADVLVSPDVIGQVSKALNTQAPFYASGQVLLSDAKTWATRAYSKIYAKVPFMQVGVPGCGMFAVNKSGREKWGTFPDIISDDTFVRLQFTPEQRTGVPATYQWPLVEGFRNLVNVRRRQNLGVMQIKEQFPHLLANDGPKPLTVAFILRLAIQHPLGFLVYAAVSIAVKLRRGDTSDWSRGR